MRRKLLIGDDPRLRTKAATVGAELLVRPDTQDLIDDLIDMTDNLDGLGMAAPQVGESLRIAAVNLSGVTKVLVNPTITWRSDTLVKGEEGCFSFPGLFGKVARHTDVEVRALDRSGAELSFRAEGLDARVIQHELDHLDGILLPDRLAEKVEAPDEAPAPAERTF